MRKSVLILMVLTATMLFASVASAQTSATATATATAEIITPISIANTADLDFGVFASPTAAVNATVAADAAGTYSGSATQIGSTVSAKFDVDGHPSATYAVTIPASVDLVSGLNSMTATLTYDCETNSGCTAIPAGGSDVLYVGGTLGIGAGQASGVYTSAAFDVTVAYN